MKTLLVYYSRTGVTRTVAEALAECLQCDIEELIDMKDRSGSRGYLVAGKDAALKRPTEIAPTEKDPAAYELVAIGTPVWAFTMTPAVRTYISEHREAFRKVAFFCTMGGSGDERTFKAMADLAGAEPVAVLALKEKDVKADRCGEKVSQFASQLVQ